MFGKKQYIYVPFPSIPNLKCTPSDGQMSPSGCMYTRLWTPGLEHTWTLNFDARVGVAIKQRRNADGHKMKWRNIDFSSLWDKFRQKLKQNYLVVEPSQRGLLQIFLSKKL